MHRDGLKYHKKDHQHHGGKIWIESEVEVGSTFFFLIPKENKQGVGFECLGGVVVQAGCCYFLTTNFKIA